MKIKGNDIIDGKSGAVLGRVWQKHGIWFGQFFCQTYEVEELTDYENGTEEVEVPYFAVATLGADSKSELANVIMDIGSDTMHVPFGGSDVRYAVLAGKRDEEWPFKFMRTSCDDDLENRTSDFVTRVHKAAKERKASEKRTAERRFEPHKSNLNINQRDGTSVYFDAVITDDKGEGFRVKEYKMLKEGAFSGWLYDTYYGHKFPNIHILKSWIIKSVERFEWNEERNRFDTVYKERGIKINDDIHLAIRDCGYGANVTIVDADGTINIGQINYATKRVALDPEFPDDTDIVADEDRVLPPFKKSTEKYYGSYIEGGIKAAKQWILDNVVEIRFISDGECVGLLKDGTIAKA